MTNTAWFHLYEMSKIVKLREADGRILPGTGSGETGSYYSMGVKFQLYRMNKFYRSAVQHCNIHLKLCQEVDPMLCSTHTHTHTHTDTHACTLIHTFNRKFSLFCLKNQRLTFTATGKWMSEKRVLKSREPERSCNSVCKWFPNLWLTPISCLLKTGWKVLNKL